jgi:hypothetical protein
MEQAKKKRPLIGVIVGIITFTLVYWGIQYVFFRDEFVNKQLVSASSEVNKLCPVMVDSETRLDNTVALPENVFQYNYTLINMAKDDIDVEQLKTTVEPAIINNVKTNPDVKTFRDNNITMAYYYYDKNNLFLFKIIVKPEQYK